MKIDLQKDKQITIVLFLSALAIAFVLAFSASVAGIRFFVPGDRHLYPNIETFPELLLFGGGLAILFFLCGLVLQMMFGKIISAYSGLYGSIVVMVLCYQGFLESRVVGSGAGEMAPAEILLPVFLAVILIFFHFLLRAKSGNSLGFLTFVLLFIATLSFAALWMPLTSGLGSCLPGSQNCISEVAKKNQDFSMCRFALNPTYCFKEIVEHAGNLEGCEKLIGKELKETCYLLGAEAGYFKECLDALGEKNEKLCFESFRKTSQSHSECSTLADGKSISKCLQSKSEYFAEPDLCKLITDEILRETCIIDLACAMRNLLLCETLSEERKSECIKCLLGEDGLSVGRKFLETHVVAEDRARILCENGLSMDKCS